MDYTDGCFRWCHDLVTLHYSDDQVDYPVYFKLWEPADWIAVLDFFRNKGVKINEEKVKLQAEDPKKFRDYARDVHKRKAMKYPSIKKIYKTKLDIAEDLVAQFKANYPNLQLPIVLDSGFASGWLCETIKRKYCYDYVGAKRLDTTFTNEQGEKTSFQELADSLRTQLKQGHNVLQKTSYKYHGEKQIRYIYTLKAHVSAFKKKQKIIEIVGNEGRRIGGERKMKRIQTGSRLLKRLLIEIFHNP